MGKLLVLEGLDASGKETQAELLYNRLLKDGENIIKVNFPNYEEESSVPVKIYLSGELGKSAYDVNPYAASTFFAVDRYISYKKHWEGFYKQGGIVLCDRYTTSNAPHNGSKLSGKEREEYFSWLYDFEFKKMELPKPDVVFFLDMPVEFSEKLMETRKNKFDQSEEKDIHERDRNYLKECYLAAKEAVSHYGWQVIPCVSEGKLRTIEEIHNEIYKKAKDVL